jgi:deoxyribodipyrimidine photo-lyase
LFILDPKLLNSTNVGKKRLAFLFASLFELDAGLKARGSKLLVRKGNPADVFQELTYEITVKRVFAQRDYSPYSSSRDEQVAKLVPLDLVPGISVSDPESIRKESGEP